MQESPKAESVTVEGKSDGWVPPLCWRSQTAPDGSTRLVVSAPPEKLQEVHLKLLASMGDTLGVMYAQLTDRKQKGPHPKPVRHLGLELPAEKVFEALGAAKDLIWWDGRHQLWVRGKFGDQVVLDELGVIYCYPDDPSFRDALQGIEESKQIGMDSRDYVKVNFRSEADAQEQALIAALNLTRLQE